MPDFCTCGAQLPPDARFCHKCGKPQRDEPLIVEEQPVVIAIPRAAKLPVEPIPISFHNALAIRIALFAGVLGFLLALPAGPLGPLVGGFFAVHLYIRRTGQKLTIANGARLGWISGLFVFVILTVLITLVAFAFTEPDVVAAFKQQMAGRPSFSEADTAKLIELFRSPSGIGSVLFVSFLTSTLLPMLSGAVGAKLLGRTLSS